MKTQIGYAILSKKGNLAVIQGELPIYWRKDVALKRASNFNGFKVVKVEVALAKEATSLQKEIDAK